MQAYGLLVLLAASAALAGARELRGASGVQSEVILLESEVVLIQPDDAAADNATEASGANATAADADANATVADAPTAPTAAPSMSEKEKEGMTKAKIQAYMKKIKLFQRLKKQRWDPIVEEELAQHLVMLDDIMKVSPEEKEIETKLRTKMNGYGVEISLNRRAQERSGERRKKRGERRAARKEQFLQRSKKRAMAREALQVRKVLKRYKKLAVPKELKAKHITAEREYRNAVQQEDSKKKAQHFKEFSKEYGLAGKTPGAENAKEGGQAPPQELGEDANKHKKGDDHIQVMTVQRVQEQLGQLEQDSSSSEASLADNMDDSLSDEALKKIRASDAMIGSAP